MTQEDKVEIERLKKLTKADPRDKMSAQKMVQRYLGSGHKFCLSCASGVRALWAKLRQIDTNK